MSSPPRRRGVFPGSFNPLTIAHLEVARLAMKANALDEVHLVVSRVALDKPTPPGPSFDDRIALLEADVKPHPWLQVATTEHQLIVDIAADFDVVIMGADKWKQVNDVSYYEGAAARDAAVSNLPKVVVAERADIDISGASATVLHTPSEIHDVSSTEARAGNRDLMAPKAAQGWSDESAVD